MLPCKNVGFSDFLRGAEIWVFVCNPLLSECWQIFQNIERFVGPSNTILKAASTVIKNLADSIEDFCRIAALASLFEAYSNITIDGKPFKEFFADFSPVLNDFEQALKANDTVSVGDLAEYEICPRLLAIAKTLENIV